MQTLELVPLYSKITPTDPALAYEPPAEGESGAPEEEFDYAASLVVFTESKALELGARFRRDADAYYVEAKRSTVSSVAQIPYWMYGVLVVLGWNEAMLVLFNPLYFALTLVMLASACVPALFSLSLPLACRRPHADCPRFRRARSRWIAIQLRLVGPLLQLTGTIVHEVRTRSCLSAPHAS